MVSVRVRVPREETVVSSQTPTRAEALRVSVAKSDAQPKKPTNTANKTTMRTRFKIFLLFILNPLSLKGRLLERPQIIKDQEVFTRNL
ncbi:hypothetical protein ES703_114382 [subsurface metagenome]